MRAPVLILLCEPPLPPCSEHGSLRVRWLPPPCAGLRLDTSRLAALGGVAVLRSQYVAAESVPARAHLFGALLGVVVGARADEGCAAFPLTASPSQAGGERHSRESDACVSLCLPHWLALPPSLPLCFSRRC